MERRRVLQFGLGGIAGLGAVTLPLTGARKAMAATDPETTVYVSNAGSKDIYVLAMNRETGVLDLIEKTPVPGTDKPSPSSLPISTFVIDQHSGRLTYVDSTPLVDQMAYLNVDGTGNYLFGASYVGAKLAIYPINALYIVEEKPTQILDTKPKAHCVVIDSSNKNVYVPVLGGDEVLQLKFDAAKGTVSPNSPGEVHTKPGAGPRHLTIHPNGRWAYLITETTATIGTYAIDKEKGTLSEVQFVDTGDYNQKDSAAASDIHVTPNGKFVYGAVRTTSMLHGYKIDPDKGTLTPVGKWPTEKTPRGFNIDPRGKFLLSVGLDSAAMTVHAIDQGSGELKAIGHYPMGTQPNWIEIVDLS